MPVGIVAVRVVPRSSGRGVSVQEGALVVRVRSVPEAGKATEEARLALADALDVPRSSVRLRSGARSRSKLFEVEGWDTARVLSRLAQA